MTDLVSSIQSQVASINNEVSSIQEMASQAQADPMAFVQALMTAQSVQAQSSSQSMGVNSGLQAGYSGGVSGGDVVNQAEKYLGVPYVYGGESPSGFDCSGLVQKVFSNLGISVPRGSDAQSQLGTPVASIAQAQPGDLLFFNSEGDPTGHVGIYVGNGMMIDAPHTGSSVRIEPVWSSLTSIRRVVPPSISESAQNGYFGTAMLVQVPGVGVESSQGSVGLVAANGISPGAPSGNVPSAYVPMFMSAATQYGVSPQLLAAVAQVESGFNPNAVSSAGAEGIMQLMPSTAQSLGVNPYNPQQAIDGAAQMLSGLIAKYGSVPLALAAYNAGPGAVDQYGGIPPYPETQAYVNQVMSLMGGSGA